MKFIKLFYLHKKSTISHVANTYDYSYVQPSEFKYIEKKNYPFWAMIKNLLRGDRCYGIKKDGKLVSSIWYSTAFIESYGVRIKLKPNEAFLYSLFTEKEYRNQSLATNLCDKVHNILNSKGIDTFYAISMKEGEEALRFKEKLLGQQIGLYMHVRPLKKSFKVK